MTLRKKNIATINLRQLLNDAAYKNFSVEGLRNIIGNVLSYKDYNLLEGKDAEEKATILYNKFNFLNPVKNMCSENE